jgi:serine/threonine protein phosphatase PrpC
VLKPEQVIREARKLEDPQKAAEGITRMALDRGSTDNITVIVIDLRKYSKDLKRETMEITTVTDFGVKE